jgi:hypothetical protein
LRKKGFINITLQNEILELLDIVDPLDTHDLLDIHPKGFMGFKNRGLKYELLQ